MRRSQSRHGRAAVACDFCYTRKIKCIDTGDASRCDWCMHHDVTCTFTRRLIILRKPEYTKGNENSDDNSSPIQMQARSETPRSNEALKDGSIGFTYHGMPLFSTNGQEWLAVKCEPTDLVRGLLSQGFPWEKRNQKSDAALPTCLRDGAYIIPDRFIVESCKALYHHTDIGLLGPLTDMTLLDRDIDLVYSPEINRSPQYQSSLASILSFVAYCSIAGHTHNMIYPVDGEAYALEAEHLLPAILSDESKVENIQTVLLLAMYHCLRGNSVVGRRLMVIISQLVTDYAKNIDIFTPDSPSEVIASDCHHFRILFWIAFAVDKEIWSRTGLSPVIFPDNMNSRPETICCWDFDPLSLIPQQLCKRSRHMFAFITLSILKADIYIELYSPAAMRKSDAEIVKTIRTLDTRLELWRLSVPTVYRPASNGTPLPTASKTGLMLNLKFRYCLSIVHQAVCRCKTMLRGLSLTGAFQSSLAISVQASRSSIVLLRTEQFIPSCEMFWVICVYPMSAVLDIFCKIVISPRNPSSLIDFELLEDIATFWTRMDTRHLTAIERIQLNNLIIFVVGLRTIAKSLLNGVGTD